MKTSRIIDIPLRRGFSAVGLYRAKDSSNVGAVLRAAYCFKVAMVVIQGARYHKAPTDTPKAYKNLPLIHTEDLLSIVPYDSVPIAVDLLPDAIPLPAFHHPERAFYIFGPEDGTLGDSITSKCKYSLCIPSRGCLNLAMAVNIILYDREAKHYHRNWPWDLPMCQLSQMA